MKKSLLLFAFLAAFISVSAAQVINPFNGESSFTNVPKKLVKKAPITSFDNQKMDVKILADDASWTSLGLAKYRDDIICSVFSITPCQYEVEVQESTEKPGVYRLVNPYGEPFPENYEGDWDTTQDYYMIIDASNPDKVVVGYTETGTDWGYGIISFESVAQYMLENGSTDEEVVEAGMYGKLENSIITFPEKSFYLGMGESYPFPYFTACWDGMFRLILPGGKDFDSSFAAAGTYLNENSQNVLSTKIDIASDIEYAKVGYVFEAYDGDEALLSAIENGSIASEQVTESGRFDFVAEKPGTYYVGMIAYAEGEIKGSYVVQIKSYGNDWVETGSVYILDGWLVGGAGYDPSEYVWETKYYTSASNKGLIRIYDMYGGEAPTAEFAQAKNDIFVNIFDPEYVVIEPQYTGNDFFSDGTAYIANAASIYPLFGYDKDYVIEQGQVSTYDFESGIISIPSKACKIDFGADYWYYTSSEAAFQFDPAPDAGVQEVIADKADEKTEYFNLQGMKISNPQAGSLYIVRKGNDVKKTIF